MASAAAVGVASAEPKEVAAAEDPAAGHALR